MGLFRPNVGGLIIHLMLGKTLENECLGSYGTWFVMHVLEEFELKEIINLVNLPKCLKQVLNEFPNAMLEGLLDELPREDKSTMQSR